MILDVIRHGRTAANAAGRFNADDEPLLPEAAAALQALDFRAEGYARVYVSPTRRCRDTARALGVAAIEADARLAERAFGVFAGLTPEECRARHGEAFEAFARYDQAFAIPGGESRAQHHERHAAWLADVCDGCAGPILLIGHGGTLDFLYRAAMGLALHGGAHIYAGENAALSTFRIAGAQIELIRFSVPLGTCWGSVTTPAAD